MEDLRRSAVEQEQLHKLCEMKAQLENIDSPVLDQAALDSLGVKVGHPIDIDGFWDFGPHFFQPWVPHELLAQAADDCSGAWEERFYQVTRSQNGHMDTPGRSGSIVPSDICTRWTQNYGNHGCKLLR